MAWGMGKLRVTEEQCREASPSPSAFQAGRSISRCRNTTFESLPSVGWHHAQSHAGKSRVATPPVASACDVDWLEQPSGRVRQLKALFLRCLELSYSPCRGLEWPQQALAVVLQLTDRVANIVERKVSRGLAKALGDIRRPAQRELFERADIEITVMKERLQ
jgi:hypothetical protein